MDGGVNLSEIKGNDPESIMRRLKLYVTESAGDCGNIHTRAEDNYHFVSPLGDQWEKADRKRMNTARIPALNINKMHTSIEQISGREQTGRYEPRAMDRSGDAAALAEVSNEFMRQVRARGDAEDEESDSFRDLCIAAYGWVDFQTDTRGRVPKEKITAIPVYEMLWDQTCRRRNLRDREWHMRGKRIAATKFLAMFPDWTHKFDELKEKSELDWQGERSQESSRVPWMDFTKGRFWSRNFDEVFLVEAEWKDAENYVEIDLPSFVVSSLGDDLVEDLSPYGAEERPESEAFEALRQMLGEGGATLQAEVTARQEAAAQAQQQIQTLRQELPAMQQQLAAGTDEMGNPLPVDPQAQAAYDQAAAALEQASQQLNQISAELEMIPVELDQDFYEDLYSDLTGIRVFELERDVYRWAFAVGNQVLESGRRPENYWTKLVMAGFSEKRPDSTHFYCPVDLSKDHQRWTNKWYSLAIEIVMRIAKSPIIAQRGTLGKISDFVRKWAQPGAVVEVDGDPNSIVRTFETRMPPEVREMMAFASNSVESTMGLNSAATGDVGGDLRRISGQAIQSLQQSVQVVLAGLFTALRQFRKEEGRLLLRKMVAYYSSEDLVKIVGRERVEALPAHRQLWREALELDMVVDEVPTLPVERMRTLEMMTNTALAQFLMQPTASYPEGALPPEYLVKLLELPAGDKEEIQAHMERQREMAAQQPIQE